MEKDSKITRVSHVPMVTWGMFSAWKKFLEVSTHEVALGSLKW